MGKVKGMESAVGARNGGRKGQTHTASPFHERIAQPLPDRTRKDDVTLFQIVILITKIL